MENKNTETQEMLKKLHEQIKYEMSVVMDKGTVASYRMKAAQRAIKLQEQMLALALGGSR